MFGKLVSSRYRDERRVPAKDENGMNMADLSPSILAVSPVVTPQYEEDEHGGDVRQSPHPNSDHAKVRAHAIRQSELFESTGSIAVDSSESSERAPLASSKKNSEGRNKKHQHASRKENPHDRQPLQVVNQGGKGPSFGKGDARVQGQQHNEKATETFKSKHLRQMQAANAQLSAQVKRRSAEGNPAKRQVPASRGIDQGSSEIKKTHFQVSEPTVAKGGLKTTEALLRAVSARDKKVNANRGTGARSAATLRNTAASAQKVVYTLKSPGMANTDERGTAPISGAGVRPQSQPPPTQREAQPDRSVSDTPAQQGDTRAGLSPNEQRSVAALVGGFEKRAASASPVKRDTSYTSPSLAAAPQPAERTNSGRKLWPPFNIVPQREARTESDHCQQGNEDAPKDNQPKDPRIRYGTVQPPAQPPLIPPRPISTAPGAVPTLPDAVQRPKSPRAWHGSPRIMHAQPGQVTGFGSPFKQRNEEFHEPQDQVAMSCNVNMASPCGTGQKMPWSNDREADGSTSEQVMQTPELPTQRKKSEQEATEQESGLPSAQQESKLVSAVRLQQQIQEERMAVTPLAPPAPPVAPQRMSTTSTSPVDSLWRPLKKALTPPPKDPLDEDPLAQNLLAPDGSPADLDMDDIEFGVSQKTSLPTRPSSGAQSSQRAATAGPSSSRDPDIECQPSGGSSRFTLQPAVSRGALETSAARLRDSAAFDEPFVDLLGVQVSSAYLKARGVARRGTSCCCMM